MTVVPNVTVATPVIDFASTGTLAASVPAFAPTTPGKSWLKDYLGNVGQASKPSPNLGLKVTIPAAKPVAASNRA